VLKTFNIFDYSLLLGVVRPQNQQAIKSEYSMTVGELGKLSHMILDLRKFQCGEKPLDMVINGGIPALDKEGNHCYLYVGIVDVLQDFDAAHKWQYGWKAVKHGISQLPFVSVQPPGKYRGKLYLNMLNMLYKIRIKIASKNIFWISVSKVLKINHRKHPNRILKKMQRKIGKKWLEELVPRKERIVA